MRAMFDALLSTAERAVAQETERREAEKGAAAATLTGDCPRGSGDDDGNVVFEREEEGKLSQADAIVRLVEQAGVELWHTPGEELHATTSGGADGERAEHHLINSRGFRRWVQRQYFELHAKAPRREALSDAFGVLEGRALAGPQYEIHVRLAGKDGKLFLDLADAERRIVEIGPGGWHLVTKTPVRFRRPPGMLPLPVPSEGGSLALLRPLLNLPDDDAWYLVVGFLVAACHPSGPYPVLVLLGEQGTAKSMATRLLTMLLDPKDVPLRRPPREERDLAIAAKNGRLLAFNNLSDLSAHMSDALSALATEGGFAARTLYSDDEESRFRDRRPVIANGIVDFVTRGDLADRSLKITLQKLPRKQRRTEADILEDFDRARPGVLGALCEAASIALRDHSKIQIAERPRMADTAQWITAAEPALGLAPGSFLRAQRRGEVESAVTVVDSDPVGVALLAFAPTQPWRGSAKQLLKTLTDQNAEVAKSREWPKNPQLMRSILRRLAPSLRELGFVVEQDTVKDAQLRTKLWTIGGPGDGRGLTVGSPSRNPSPRSSDAVCPLCGVEASDAHECGESTL